MRDPLAFAKKVNQTYWELGNKLDNGDVNWFIFAAYGTAEVVRTIAAVKDDMPEVADSFASGAGNMFFHVIKDPEKVAVELLPTAEREQRLLQPYLEAAFGDVDPVWITGDMKVTFPHCEHWASQGALGAPVVNNWLVFDERWAFIQWVLLKHAGDRSLLRSNPGAEWADEVEVFAPGSPWGA